MAAWAVSLRVPGVGERKPRLFGRCLQNERWPEIGRPTVIVRTRDVDVVGAPHTILLQDRDCARCLEIRPVWTATTTGAGRVEVQCQGSALYLVVDVLTFYVLRDSGIRKVHQVARRLGERR